MENKELERRVIESLHAIKAHYDQIDALIQHENNDSTDGVMGQRLDEIQTERKAIEQLQLEIKPVNEEYIATREHASDEVRSLSRKIADQVQDLIVKFATLEHEARETQKKMLPVINENLRALKMKSAYGRSVTQ